MGWDLWRHRLQWEGGECADGCVGTTLAGLPTSAHRGLPRKEGLISQRSGANLKPGESGISRKLKLSTFTRSETLILTCIGEVEPLPVFSKSKIQLIYIRKALFFTRLFEIFPQIFPQTPHPPFGIFVFMLP